MLGIIVAATVCWSVSANKPDYTSELLLRGMQHAQNAEYQKAEQHFTEALRLYPSEYQLWQLRSIARGMLGNVAGAASDWDMYLYWHPETVLKKVEDAYTRQDWSMLISLTEPAHLRKNLSPIGCYFHACALVGLNRELEALSFLKRALDNEKELQGLSAWAHFVYAQCLLAQYQRGSDYELLQKSLMHLNHAWEQGYRTASLLTMRAMLCCVLKQQENAIRYQRMAVMMESRSLPHRMKLISYLAEAQRWQDAQEELAWLKRFQPTPDEKVLLQQFISQYEPHLAKMTRDHAPAEKTLDSSFVKDKITSFEDQLNRRSPR